MIAPSTAAELARARGLAERAELPWIDLDAETIEPEAAALIPLDLMTEALAVPFSWDGSTLRVAIADPSTRQELAQQVGIPMDFVVASRAAVMNVLGSLRQARRSSGALIAVEQPRDGEGTEHALIARAVEAGATDLHFVPCEAGLTVRARIDGLLRTIGRIPSAAGAASVSRLEVQSHLDISEHRRSQEGRMSLASSSGREFDIRVTTFPTVAGEGAALRILERTGGPPTLTEIGFSPALQLSLERVVNERRGALLVTGPTSSGKSTTIHAALADIARPELNVITVEDPVEYRLDGTYQIEVNPHVGLTFEAALRSILRTDPDVIAVGEMRDLATATTTLKAALSGSFVLSPAAITRLLDMGVEPYVAAATLTAVIAQRLVRRLCVHCRVRYVPTRAERADLGSTTTRSCSEPSVAGSATAATSARSPSTNSCSWTTCSGSSHSHARPTTRSSRSRPPQECARSGTTGSRKRSPGRPRSKSSLVQRSPPTPGRSCGNRIVPRLNGAARGERVLPARRFHNGFIPGSWTASRQRVSEEEPRLSGASRRADDGTRTHDLLHGKQTL